MLEDLREFGDVEKSPGNLSLCARISLVREDVNNIPLPHFGNEQPAPLEPGGDEASLTITAPEAPTSKPALIVPCFVIWYDK